MPRISVRTQILCSLLALAFIGVATVFRLYSYTEKGIEAHSLYAPLTLWIAAFIDYAFIIYLSYLKEVLRKRVPAYKIITYIALAALAVCTVCATLLEYTLSH